MSQKVQITEYLDIDLDREIWCCNRCGRELISAGENFKRGCLVYERDPRTVYDPVSEDELFAPDPGLCAFVEFYCPGCGVMIDNELLLLGHPITYDTELDLEKLRSKYQRGA